MLTRLKVAASAGAARVIRRIACTVFPGDEVDAALRAEAYVLHFKGLALQEDERGPHILAARALVERIEERGRRTRAADLRTPTAQEIVSACNTPSVGVEQWRDISWLRLEVTGLVPGAGWSDVPIACPVEVGGAHAAP